MTHQSKTFVKLFLRFLPIAVVIVLLSGLIYVTGQQINRMGANDPQIEIAENLARTYGQGNDQPLLANGEKSDITQTLSPFAIRFDQNGQPIDSTTLLDGLVPTPPAGVLRFAKDHGEDRVTWQPKKGVRIASVIKYFSGKQTGYILVGRSLREVEKRQDALLTQLALGSVATLIALLIATPTAHAIQNSLQKHW